METYMHVERNWKAASKSCKHFFKLVANVCVLAVFFTVLTFYGSCYAEDRKKYYIYEN